MPNRPIRLSIEPEKFDRRYAKVYTSRDGKVRRFYQLVAWENRDGRRDENGNTHLVKQGLPKEFKDQGVDPNSLPIVGNLSMPEDDGTPRRPASRPAAGSSQQPRQSSTRQPAKDPNEDWGS